MVLFMQKKILPILWLALFFVLLTSLLFWLEQHMGTNHRIALARQLIVLPGIFFTYTFVEMGLVHAFDKIDANYKVSLNLAFSVFRLLLTLLLIFIFKKIASPEFHLSVINIFACYVLTLLFSTWFRSRQQKKSTPKV